MTGNTYDPKDLKILTKAGYREYLLNEFDHVIEEVGIVVDDKRMKNINAAIKTKLKKYDDVLKNGVDIGNSIKCIINVKNIVTLKTKHGEQLGVLTKNDMLFFCDHDLDVLSL